jgi:very-short-patch-repair endonuclease
MKRDIEQFYCIKKLLPLTELKLVKALQTRFDQIRVCNGNRYRWCVKNRMLVMDIVLEEYRIIIELDGIQHFESVYGWNHTDAAFQRSQSYDDHKNACAILNGYRIIRIFQKDFAGKRIPVKALDKLVKIIEQIRDGNIRGNFFFLPSSLPFVVDTRYSNMAEKVSNLEFGGAVVSEKIAFHLAWVHRVIIRSKTLGDEHKSAITKMRELNDWCSRYAMKTFYAIAKCERFANIEYELYEEYFASTAFFFPDVMRARIKNKNVKNH